MYVIVSSYFKNVCRSLLPNAYALTQTNVLPDEVQLQVLAIFNLLLTVHFPTVTVILRSVLHVYVPRTA